MFSFSLSFWLGNFPRTFRLLCSLVLFINNGKQIVCSLNSWLTSVNTLTCRRFSGWSLWNCSPPPGDGCTKHCLSHAPHYNALKQQTITIGWAILHIYSDTEKMMHLYSILALYQHPQLFSLELSASKLMFYFKFMHSKLIVEYQ